jgi:hypothetical protein
MVCVLGLAGQVSQNEIRILREMMSVLPAGHNISCLVRVEINLIISTTVAGQKQVIYRGTDAK